MRANDQDWNTGLIWRKGLGTSRADISGSGRQSCEPEFNYTGCEQSRSEMERWKILHSAKDLKQKGRNVERSADVSGNARHFCDCELNFKENEGSQNAKQPFKTNTEQK